MRRRARETSVARGDGARPFNTADVTSFTGRAASGSLSTDALVSAFRQERMRPLNPSVITKSQRWKGADVVVAEVEHERLTSRVIPSVHKDMSQPVLVNGALSTAARGTVVTTPQILAAMVNAAAEKEAVKEAKAAKKLDRELTTEEKKGKRYAVARARHARIVKQEAFDRRIVSAGIASDAAHEAWCRLRDVGMFLPSTANARRRLEVARVCVPRVLPHILWRELSGEAAGVWSRLHIKFCERRVL